MSDEERDLRRLRRALAKAKAKRAGRREAGRPFFDDLEDCFREPPDPPCHNRGDFRIDSPLSSPAHQPVPAAHLSRQRSVFSHLRRRATIEFGALETCRLSDPEVDNLVKTLYREKRLSKNELRLLLSTPVIDRGNDQLLEAVGPTRRDFLSAKIGIAVVGLSVAVGISWILREPFWLPHALGPSFALGCVAGWIGRGFYYRAWGRRDLAIKLRLLLPWIRLRMQDSH